MEHARFGYFTTRAQQPVDLIGPSQRMMALRHEIERVARSDAKVLITGESGVGKEIVARGIHARSPRAAMTYAPVNCAGLPETLLESELFGHVRGSFTGAHRDKPGKLDAHMGTVFLDEIGEMTLRMQGLLLRFLETGELQRVGADGMSRRVNVRVIAATNRDLRERIGQMHFREDLYYRLNVVNIQVPPLREHREDIPALVNHFVVHFARINAVPVPDVPQEVLKAMIAYSWPGNVRELENAIERMVVTVHGGALRVEDLPAEIRAEGHIAVRPKRDRRRSVADDLMQRLIVQRESFWTAVYPLYMGREITRDQMREVIRRGLEQSRGNYKLLARMFNMEPQQYKRFLNFLRSHGCHIPYQEYRECSANPPDPINRGGIDFGGGAQ
jgi:transcriptional regulator with GAF, ATPase, and Fis domain